MAENAKQPDTARGYPLPPLKGALGALLVMVGLGWLLSRLGYLPSGQLFQLIRIWPIILVIVGIDMLMRNRGRVTPAWVAPGLVAMAALMVWSTSPRGWSSRQDGQLAQHSTPLIPSAQPYRVQVEAGAANLTISTTTQDRIRVDSMDHLPRIDHRDNQIRIVAMEGRWGSCTPLAGPDRHVDVLLPRQPPISLQLESGASRVNANLAQANLASLHVSAGAAKLFFRLPPPNGEVQVKFNIGACDVKMEFPANVALKMASSTILSDTDIRGLALVRKDDSLATAGFDLASDRYVIDLDGAASSFDISTWVP